MYISDDDIRLLIASSCSCRLQVRNIVLAFFSLAGSLRVASSRSIQPESRTIPLSLRSIWAAYYQRTVQFETNSINQNPTEQIHQLDIRQNKMIINVETVQ